MKSPRFIPARTGRRRAWLLREGFSSLSREEARRFRTVALGQVPVHFAPKAKLATLGEVFGLFCHRGTWYVPDDVHAAYGFVRECFAHATLLGVFAARAVHQDPARLDVLYATWALTVVTKPVVDTREARQALRDLLETWTSPEASAA